MSKGSRDKRETVRRSNPHPDGSLSAVDHDIDQMFRDSKEPPKTITVEPRNAIRRTYSVERECEACGSHSPYRGFEDAHIVPDAGSEKGCQCPENMMCLCWRCHRMIVHGLGGWTKLLEMYRHLRPRYQVALDHYEDRRKGLGCGANTKCGQLAQMRQRGLM